MTTSKEQMNLVAAVGDRPMETYRIANRVRPTTVWLLHTAETAGNSQALKSLLTEKLGVTQVDQFKVPPFHVPPPTGFPDASENRRIAIAASGGTKPMLWGIQRWYDGLDPLRKAGAYAVNESDGHVFLVDLGSDSAGTQVSINLDLEEIAGLHQAKILNGSASSQQPFLASKRFDGLQRQLCNSGDLPGDAKQAGKLLEKVVAQALANTNLPGCGYLNPKVHTSGGREFELDVVRCHQGRVWVLECKYGTPDFELALQDMAEVELRARQVGGADVRSGLLIRKKQRADQLNDMEYLWVWNRPEVFHWNDLKGLLGCDGASSTAILDFFNQ